MDGWQIIADRDGIFSVADARRAGLTWRDLSRLVTAEEAVTLSRGWYSLPPAALDPDEDSPIERRRQNHALRTRAMIRTFSGRAVASHHSALVLHSLPIFSADLRQVHVMRSGDDLSRRRRGLTVHEHVGGATSDSGVVEIPVAAVQVGAVNGAMASLVAVDAALHRELMTTEDLDRALSLVDGPGMGAVRRILTHVDPRAESPGETRVRHAMYLMGMPSTPQFRIEDGAFLAVVDFLLDEAPVVIEFDGFVKYGRTVKRPGDPAPGDVVFAEKVREDHIRGMGYGFVRVIWSDLEDPPGLRSRIESAVEQTRGRTAA